MAAPIFRKLTTRIADSVKSTITTSADTQLASANSLMSTAQGYATSAISANLPRAFQIDGRGIYVEAYPGSSWNGTAGTGFTTPPSDPTRTTAKPAMRMLTVPNQQFTDYQVIGVAASANNRGRMDNLGLKQVNVYYEGTTVVIPEPSYYSYQDVNGVTRTTFGWWAVLRYNGTNAANTSGGGAQVYFEAVPRDATMQNRVTGPFTYFPVSTLYDVSVDVAPSQAVIAGSRYQTVEAALGYLRDQNSRWGRVRITETGTYTLNSIGTTYTGTTAFTTIEATAAATFALAPENKGQFRPNYAGIRFRGKNIILDMRYVQEIRPELTGLPYWFNGCVIKHSGGRDELWDKGTRPIGYISRNYPYYTDCTISGVTNPCVGAALVRNSTISAAWGDVASASRCVVGNRIDDWTSTAFRSELTAFTVSYTGAGTATLALSGANDASSRTFTAKVNGTSVGTLTIQNTSPVGANYNVSEVVTWLSGLSGWSATLSDNTRRATYCGLSGMYGAAFGDTAVTSSPLSITTYVNFSSNWYQVYSSLTENVIAYNNQVTGISGSDITVNTGTPMDCVFFNNTFQQDLSGWGSGRVSTCGVSLSHVVIAHNSLPDQQFDFVGSYDADSYTLVSNNVVKDFTGTVGTAHFNNHTPGVAITTLGTGLIKSGTLGTLYPFYSDGDFTPSGELITYMKQPVIKSDLLSVSRISMAPVGATC